MTLENFYKKLKEVGVPVAYALFKEATQPPFIVYEVNARDDEKADDISYCKIQEGFVELYTDYKDLEKEKAIEQIFEKDLIPYAAVGGGYIESENMFLFRWLFQLI